MKPHRSLLLILAAGLLAGTVAWAADGHKHDHATPAASGKLIAPAKTDAAWLAKARETYPLKICVVSDDELGGDMGEAVDRIYRVEGKPDRLIRFCCKSCFRDFEKMPAEFLRKLDKPAESKPVPSPHHH